MNKYHNTPTTLDGRRFASKAEAARFAELKLLERAGVIASLECQPRYPLTVEGSLICTYVADFAYIDTIKRREVVEDVKGVKTKDFKIKAALFTALYPKLELRLIGRGRAAV